MCCRRVALNPYPFRHWRSCELSATGHQRLARAFKAGTEPQCSFVMVNTGPRAVVTLQG